MEMSGEYRIPAPRERVWAALNDPEILKDCIPGCQALEKLSDTEMTAKVQAKVGPVKATFTGNVTLSNIDPPNGYTITGEGKGGVAGFAKGGADVKLSEEGDDTVLRYTARAQVGGKLAQIGARLVDATAKQMADEFFGALARRVADDGPPPSEREAVAADLVNDPMVVAEAIEERAEVAAGRGFLGGPPVWGLIVLVIIIGALLILR
jgi:carbon monoxide dehydrogenase subunit G